MKDNVITVLIFLGLIAVILVMTVVVLLYIPVKLLGR